MSVSPRLARVAVPPIARAARWAALYDGRAGPLIDCSQAVPNHPPPPEFAERLARAGADAQAARYGAILGDPALRLAYAGHVSTLYGATVAPERVAVTSGCNQAFFAAMLALAEPGDAVILPVPWYFNHVMTLEMLGIEPRALPLDAASGFLPDPARVEALLGDGRVRALVLVSPNNPTGAVYPPALMEELLALCARHGIAMVLDETYRDFLTGGAPPHALFSRAESDHLVALYSFSKAYAIPGHRVGALIASAALVAEIEKAIDCLQICAPRPTQSVLPWAIGALADFRAGSAREIERRAETFRAAFGALPGWRIEQLGAYFAYMRHPFAGEPSERVAERLARDAGIVTLPGSFFGAEQDAFLRIAFANVAAPEIREIARRLALLAHPRADTTDHAA